VLVAAGSVWITVVAALGDVPWWARDLNCDGHVSIGEWYDAGIDHGWRGSMRGEPAGCMVAFEFKDGLRDVLWCEQRRCMLRRDAYGR
jgi:hypothetical protein